MSGATNVPLAPAGLRQAADVAELLAARGPFSRLFTSPLDRALVSARLVAERCKLEIEVVSALAEIDCGVADGLPLGQVQSRFPAHWRRNLEQSDPDFRWPGGESYREFRERVLGAIRSIAERHMSQRVIVVTHSGVISQIIGWVHGVSPGRWGRFRPRTGSLTELLWTAEGATVQAYDRLPLSDGESR